MLGMNFFRKQGNQRTQEQAVNGIPVWIEEKPEWDDAPIARLFARLFARWQPPRKQETETVSMAYGIAEQYPIGTPVIFAAYPYAGCGQRMRVWVTGIVTAHAANEARCEVAHIDPVYSMYEITRFTRSWVNADRLLTKAEAVAIDDAAALYEKAA